MSSLQYVTVEEAAAAMVQKGHGALLAKVDIKHALLAFRFTLMTDGYLEWYDKVLSLLILHYLSDGVRP